MTQSHCKGVCRGGAAIRCDVRDMKYQEVKRSKAQINFPCKAQKICFSTSCQNAALATSSYIQTEIEHNTSSLNIVNQILARNSIYQKKKIVTKIGVLAAPAAPLLMAVTQTHWWYQ